MSLIHDVIKIKLSKEGYLPNYPPGLISDEEMCQAFLTYSDSEDKDAAWEEFQESSDACMFSEYYPLLDDSLELEYRELVENIAYHINKFIKSSDDVKILPDWVYAYMNGSVISIYSDKRDIHDMLVMMGVDNIDDDFLGEAQKGCLKYSKEWFHRIPAEEIDHRSPSVFGEHHVIKYLRILTSDISAR